MRGLSNASAVEDGGVQKFVLPLIILAIMTAYVSIPTFRRPKSRQKGSAHWTGQLVSPFVQELPSAISFSRLNLVTNNFSSFARGETVRPPLEMSDTKSFTLFLTKDGYLL